jgi:ABC-type Fe3+-hydroxamate transport system substrate-binding protein
MKRSFTDHLDRNVTLVDSPQRIVCLCPSLTETLFAIGAGDRVVGRTRYCIHPEAGVADVATVGGTKKVDVEAVAALEPDLVIAEKEENTQAEVDALGSRWPVFVTDVVDFSSALRAVEDLGELVGCARAASRLTERIRAKFDLIQPLSPPIRAAYFIWRHPTRTAGGETYINAVLGRCGFENVCAGIAGRYPEVTIESLLDLGVALVLLSSEPFPFDEGHAREMKGLLPGVEVITVDGEMFCWYGARMIRAAEYLRGLVRRLERAPRLGNPEISERRG